MKVKLCESCAHYIRGTWVQVYKPNGYHRIGITHAFGYCMKHKKRCLLVKKCEEVIK